MIKVGSTYIRKFQFFEEVKEREQPANPQSLKNSIKINNEIEEIKKEKKDDTTISINDISLKDPKHMKVYENYIFINGSAIHLKNGQKVRENLIIKIKDNKILDEYFFFNLFYYDFIIKDFEFNPYFIVLGADFGDGSRGAETKIKIYQGQYFLKEEKINDLAKDEIGSKPYSDALIKEIKLLKKIEDNKLVAVQGGENIKGFEYLQNINVFDISDDFVFAAISIDKGGIILIYGFPNLISCNNNDNKNIKDINNKNEIKNKNDIIMKYLPTITYKDKEVNVTNIQFSKVSFPPNDSKIILYVSIVNAIFYYVWDYDSQKNSFPNNIQLKLFIEEKLVAYNSRFQIKDSLLLIGNEKMIGEYNNLQLDQTWFFEGKKSILNYFNNYIYYVIFGEEESSLQIFDKTNKFFVYQKTGNNKILSVCNDSNYIYILYEETPNKKYITQLKEKTNKEKFETFFQKKFFDDAVIYAKNLNMDEEKISEISKKQAQYEFSKGHYDRSIEEYIKTINYYEPSLVVQKFLEKSKFNFLIKYLEAIVDNFSPDNMDIEECKNYTTLLLHCYIMQEEINKLKNFIDRKGEFFSKDLMKVVIDVCIETDNADIALSIAKKHNMIYEHLIIMLTKLNEHQKVIEILEKPEKFEFKLSNKEKVELYLKFADYYLLDKKQEQENEEDLADEKEENENADKFFDSVTGFIEQNKKNLDKNDINKLIELFMDTDRYFKILFEKIGTYNLNYNKELIHRRIQLFLDDIEQQKKNKDKTGVTKYKTDLINLLQNEKYQQKYDSQYLIMLFKTNHFLEGIEVISQINKYNQDLLSIYMKKNDFEKIINICKNFGSKELSFWGTSLNYFLGKELRKKMKPDEIDILNKYFQEFLIELLKSKIMPAIDVLDMINEQNCDISYNILNQFMRSTMEEEINSIEEKKNKYTEYDNNINNVCYSIKELKTKAKLFNISVCCECGGNVDLPYYAFYCGHALHKSCLNENNKEEIIECPRCKEGQKGAKDEIQKNKKMEKNLTSLEKLEKVLDRKQNKIDFIYELYGKGLFDYNNLNLDKK